MPIELLKFTVSAPMRPRYSEAVPVWFNVQRKGLKRAGRWVTSQPRQPRIIPESNFWRSQILLISPGNLPEQLRKFVVGQPYLPHATEASWTKGIQIPPPPPPGTDEAHRRFWTNVDRQRPFTEASMLVHPQVPMDKDLYAVRRMFTSFVIYYDRFRGGENILRRVEFPAAFPVLPIELQFFVLNADSQPVQRPESSLWIPQLQALSVLPEELKRWIYGDDRMMLRNVPSQISGVQIPNPAPPLSIELQQFVVTPDFVPLQRGESRLLARYMPDTFPLSIELQQFLVTEPRQRPIIPQSSITTRKINELVAMPMELRRYVETAFQRYRSHYLILRGTFQPVPVPDVVIEYKYFRGYTIIRKDTRLTP